MRWYTVCQTVRLRYYRRRLYSRLLPLVSRTFFAECTQLTSSVYDVYDKLSTPSKCYIALLSRQ